MPNASLLSLQTGSQACHVNHPQHPLRSTILRSSILPPANWSLLSLVRVLAPVHHLTRAWLGHTWHQAVAHSQRCRPSHHAYQALLHQPHTIHAPVSSCSGQLHQSVRAVFRRSICKQPPLQSVDTGSRAHDLLRTDSESTNANVRQTRSLNSSVCFFQR